MFLSCLLHGRHHKLLMVGSNVCCFVIWRDFELAWCHFIVVCLGRDTEAVKLVLEILHVVLNARWDGAEIMIVKLLALRRCRAEQCAARKKQVSTGICEIGIDEEIFLLCTTR